MKVPAYLDSAGGLIKCMVLGRYKKSGRLVIKVTARNKVFRNHALMHYSAHRVVPRDKVIRSNWQFKILPFSWGNIAELPEYEGELPEC